MKQNTEHITPQKSGTATRKGEAVRDVVFFQPKLSINQPDDVYEQEANTMAERVMRMASHEGNDSSFFSPKPVVVQRKCKECEKEEEHVRRKEIEAHVPEIDSAFEQYITGLRSRGNPLSADERHFFEPRFNRDFSDVRIHTGTEASQSAQSIHAQAYTFETNIVFNDGRYQPQSDDGRRLMAHELTHVVQQGGSLSMKRIQRNTDDAPGSSLWSVIEAIPECPPRGQLLVSGITESEIDYALYGGKGIAITIGGDGSFDVQYNELLPEWKEKFADCVGPSEEDTREVSNESFSSSESESVSQESNATVDNEPSSSEANAHEVSNESFLSSEWKPVNQMGIVYQESGANVRNKPSPAQDGSVVIKKLSQNAKIFILHHHAQKKWYSVTTDDGDFGYVADWLIWKNLPEPEAKVLKIPKGATALDIARTHYGESFKSWGSDLRFVVNALSYANSQSEHNGIGKAGIFKTEGNDQSWADTKVTGDVYIWLPSVAFLNSLRSKVSSGSITYEIWEGIKAVAKALAFGAAFIAGILHGAFDGLVALVKGIVDLIWGALKSIFTGNVWNDLKKMWEAVTSMGIDDWKDLFFGWMTPWLENTKSSNPFKSGHAYGYIVGRILFEILLLFVGGTAVAKIVSQLGKLGSKLSKLGVIQKIGTGVSKAGGKVLQGLEKLKAVTTVSKPAQAVAKVLFKVNAKLREKILWGVNSTGNQVIGGHFRGIIGHPEYAVEILGKSTINPNCEIVKFTKALPGGRIGKIKKSTLFPRPWSKGDIIKAIEEVANNPLKKTVDSSNPAKFFLQGKIKGTTIEVIIENGQITSAYPL